MRQAERYLKTAFTVSCIYLLVVVVGGFFILPGVFRVADYNLPTVIELFLKTASVIAAVIVLSSAVILPALTLIRRSKQRAGDSAIVVATTLLIGLILVFLHALYVKLRTCPIGAGESWYCRVEGKSYLGLLALVLFIASLAGCISWVAQKVTKKK